MPPALAVGGAALGGAILGGVSGAMDKKSHSDQTSGINQNPILQGGFEQQFFGQQNPNLSSAQQEQYDRFHNIATDTSASQKDREYAYQQAQAIMSSPAGGFSTNGGMGQQLLSQLQGMVNSGPGQADYNAGINSQRSLADMFGSYAQSGGLPSQNDINSASSLTNNLFASRQTALNQSFTDQNTAAQRLAAQLGRPVNDPILQAKLRTGFIRQQDLLNADKTGASSQLALALPGQRLNYASQQTNLLSALGNQAMSNRNYLLGLGNQLGTQEQSTRLNTSERYSNGTNTQSGGLGGAISGAVGGLGSGLSIGGALTAPGGLFGTNPFSGGAQVASGGYNNFTAQAASGSSPFSLGNSNKTQFGFY